MIAISFASAMLVARNVFSRSFTISAVMGDDTGTTLSTIAPYSCDATSVQAGVTPPITFGVFAMVHLFCPGSTRSGEKARKKSLPTLSSFGLSASRRVSTRSSVDPG